MTCCPGRPRWRWHGWMSLVGCMALMMFYTTVAGWMLAYFVVSNLLLPVGALVYILFCTHRFGWGWTNFTAEANTGCGPKLRLWMRFYCAWFLPAVVMAIPLLGLLSP